MESREAEHRIWSDLGPQPGRTSYLCRQMALHHRLQRLAGAIVDPGADKEALTWRSRRLVAVRGRR